MLDTLFSKSKNSQLSDKKWLVIQEGYNSNTNLANETKFTLCNGYMGIRGSFEEGSQVSHPGNFIAGIFDKSDSWNKEIVNAPSWIGLKLYINDEPLDLDKCKIDSFVRILDMKKSILFKAYIIEDKAGRKTKVESIRFLSRNNVHRCGIKMFITPLNYEGTILVENIIDGTITSSIWNPRLRTKHFDVIENTSIQGLGGYQEVCTKDNKKHIGIGTTFTVRNVEISENLTEIRRFSTYGELNCELSFFNVQRNKTVQIEKYAVVYTCRDLEKTSIKAAVKKELDSFLKDGMEVELEKHIKVYDKLWSTADIDIEGDDEADLALRFSIFHLMSTGNEKDNNVNIAARGLHGEDYGGHAFWDTEVFMLPFFQYTNPEVARNLLLYRYNSLAGARENARNTGCIGARFAHESADDGIEECPEWYVNYDGKAIKIENKEKEYHITADVAYAIYEYYRVTGDVDFILNFGAEMLIETARFWSSIFEHNDKLDRFELLNVVGPDEYHDAVNNNAFTNYLVRWNVIKALEIIRMIKQKYNQIYMGLVSNLLITEEDIEFLENFAEKIYLPFDKKSKMIEQFDGYFNKKDYVVTKYNKKGMPLIPEELITEESNMVYEFDTNSTQLLKQADVVMLQYLLEDNFDLETIKINYEYYEKRTLHKSSLSPCTYAIMGIKIGDYTRAYDYFMKSATVDLEDNQDNSEHGLHAASTGGTWQVVMFGFAGFKLDKEKVLCFTPWLPEKWRGISFSLVWRNVVLSIEINKDCIKIEVIEGKAKDLNVRIKGKLYKVEKLLEAQYV